MPRIGGEADKFGNRYEALWVVDAALDLIDEEYASLVLEAVGDEAAGVEFFRTTASGRREYHSIKRQQSVGNWTISRLTQGQESTGRSVLGDLIRKVQEGALAVFSSGTSADELRELCERARASDSTAEFLERIKGHARLSGRFIQDIVPICGDEEASYSALRAIRLRTKLEPDLEKDIERRIRATFRMGNGELLDSTVVRLLIAEYAIQHLGSVLTAGSFTSWLSDHGILPAQFAGNSNIGQRIRHLNYLYLREVNALLINRVAITRTESTAAYDTLLSGGKSVTLEGNAGGGKSCVLAQILDQLDSHNVPSLVIRLDRLTEEDTSSRVIGTRRGLPDSPALVLGEFAGSQPSVLCVDQLDALSFVSSRHQSAWYAFNELLEEVESYPNMRVLFACRSFDLEHDARLRALVADNSRIERVPVGELDEDTVLSSIAASGTVTSPLNPVQLRLLSVPLHLYLFLETARSGEFDFTSRGDLFDAFWNHKSKNVESRLWGQPEVWSRAIGTLCDAMSRRESLIAPEFVMDGLLEAMEALGSEAVVHIQEGYVSFFHETFFDYAFARTFLREEKDLVQWLASDDQHLFRRSQVRQVLSFLRDREADKSRYLRALRGLLGDTRIRFHIKKLVLDWLRALPDPIQEEWVIVEEFAEQLGGHSWQVIGNRVPWFDLLHQMGRWKSWLRADDQRVNLTVNLLRMPEVLNARSAIVACLVSSFRGQSPEWRRRLSWLVTGGNGFTSPEMEDLVIVLISDGTLDDANPGFAMNSDWWSIWYMPSRQNPEFTARVLGAWFDRQLDRVVELGREDPFDGGPELAPYSQFSEDVIKECVSRAPSQFAREMLPRFASLEERVPRRWIMAPNWLGEPDEQLREGLRRALIAIAEEDPAELDSIMDADTLPTTKWVSSLVLGAWSSNPDVYGERIVRFLLDSPEQRLNIGYDMAVGMTDSFAAVSRTAAAAASTVCSDESFAKLEDSIRRVKPDREREIRQMGRTELALLRSLPEERVAESTRLRIQELERRFPNAPEHGAPKPPETDRAVQMVGSPISSQAQRYMSDDQWLSAMSKYSSDSPDWRAEPFVGGALELSRGLKVLVAEDPKRFSMLANKMDETLSPVYFRAILSGLTRSEEGASRASTLGQVCSVLRRIEELNIAVGGTQIAWAIETLSDETVPRDVVQMLCRVAIHDPDPSEDTWLSQRGPTSPNIHAINSARGAAAVALAALLFSDRSLWGLLKPTIESLCSDPVLSVRSVTAGCLLAVLDTHRGDALSGFHRLAEGADPILGTQDVERFINYAVFRDYPAVRPVLLRMLESSQTAAVRAGARYVTLAALWLDEAQEDESLVLERGEEARAGAAEVYARDLSNETVGAQCEKRLTALFADGNETVRQEARRCWIHLTPDQISSRGPLIGSWAQSLRSGHDVSLLAYRLKDTHTRLPVEVCDLAEHAVQTLGPKASSIQYEEAGAAAELATLMVRMHEETDDPVLRERVLDIIDEMIRAGFYGIDDEVRNHFDR